MVRPLAIVTPRRPKYIFTGVFCLSTTPTRFLGAALSILARGVAAGEASGAGQTSTGKLAIAATARVFRHTQPVHIDSRPGLVYYRPQTTHSLPSQLPFIKYTLTCMPLTRREFLRAAGMTFLVAGINQVGAGWLDRSDNRPDRVMAQGGGGSPPDATPVPPVERRAYTPGDNISILEHDNQEFIAINGTEYPVADDLYLDGQKVELGAAYLGEAELGRDEYAFGVIYLGHEVIPTPSTNPDGSLPDTPISTLYVYGVIPYPNGTAQLVKATTPSHYGVPTTNGRDFVHIAPDELERGLGDRLEPGAIIQISTMNCRFSPQDTRASFENQLGACDQVCEGVISYFTAVQDDSQQAYQAITSGHYSPDPLSIGMIGAIGL